MSKVGDYDWCSWKEYTGEVPGALGLCATNAILKRMSLDELKELVEAPLDDDVQCTNEYYVTQYGLEFVEYVKDQA